MNMAVIDASESFFKERSGELEITAPGVTLTEGHAALYQAFFSDRLRLPLDRLTSKAVTGSDASLAHPMLAVNIAIEQSARTSQQRVESGLFYCGLKIEQPAHLGDTLYTRTRIIEAKRNRLRPRQQATDVVALEVTTTNQRDERVLHFWRSPKAFCRTETDGLQDIGASSNKLEQIATLPPWRLDAFRTTLRAAAPVVAGAWFRIDERDTVTRAPDFVRMHLSRATPQTDTTLSYMDLRPAYGGHPISMAFAQITRALPDLVTIVAWESCGHTQPILENDRFRTDVTVLDRTELRSGALLSLHAKSYVSRVQEPEETAVLDWKFSAWTV
jgi:acyl dehydratase